MPWRKFLIFNALGAAFWVTVISGAGYLFGEHWQHLERTIQGFDYAVGMAAILATVFWWWKRRRRVRQGHLQS
jgi:membrane-associated protein